MILISLKKNLLLILTKKELIWSQIKIKIMDLGLALVPILLYEHYKVEMIII